MRYRGIKKNLAQMCALFGSANVFSCATTVDGHMGQVGHAWSAEQAIRCEENDFG